MNDVEKYVISKEDFKKYFDSKRVIKKQYYINYLKQKSCQMGCQLKAKKDTD